ncbi:MAG: hypothetical protein GY839_10820 [candidate division Zixibacteria bacterium]|nr:hypothetical protein [candidate division Zixibacteria bacterium]
MTEQCEAKEVVSDIFREEALLIGGLATNYNLEDALVWELCRNLDLIRSRILRKIDKHREKAVQLKSSPHPAVQELLRKIKEN